MRGLDALRPVLLQASNELWAWTVDRSSPEVFVLFLINCLAVILPWGMHLSELKSKLWNKTVASQVEVQCVATWFSLFPIKTCVQEQPDAIH